MLVSALFSAARRDPAPAWTRLPPRERLRELLRVGDAYLELLEAWTRAPGVVLARYEVLLADPAAELARVGSALGLAFGAPDVARAVERQAFARRSGRSRGSEDTASFFRKGIAGDWRNHFDAEGAKAFREAAGGRWNRLLLELGYERDSDWSP
jgi:hypothetical protein